MGRTTVAVNAQGRITLPAAARRSLGLTEGAQLDVRLEDNEIRLRPDSAGDRGGRLGLHAGVGRVDQNGP